MPKVVNVGYSKNLKVAVKQCYQVGQFQLDILENAKIEKPKCDIFADFQTLWVFGKVCVYKVR